MAVCPLGTVTADRASSHAGYNRHSILQKLLPAALADKMFYMGGLIGEGLAEYRIGQAAGAKSLPEGFARILGHDVLAVIAGDQHHDMAGALPAFVTAMDFTRRVLVVRVAHKGTREEKGLPSYASPLDSQFPRCKEVIRLTFYLGGLGLEREFTVLSPVSKARTCGRNPVNPQNGPAVFPGEATVEKWRYGRGSASSSHS